MILVSIVCVVFKAQALVVLVVVAVAGVVVHLVVCGYIIILVRIQ